MSGGLVCQGRPGEKGLAGIWWWHIDDCGSYVKSSCGVGRPGIGAKIRSAPLGEWRCDPVIRRLDTGSVLRREEAIVEIAYNLLVSICCPFIVSFTILKDGLSDIQHQTSFAFFVRVAKKDLIEIVLSLIIKFGDEWFVDQFSIKGRKFLPTGFQPSAQLVEFIWIFRTRVT